MHDRPFKTFKDMLTNTLLLSLPNFDKAFVMHLEPK